MFWRQRHDIFVPLQTGRQEPGRFVPPHKWGIIEALIIIFNHRGCNFP